MNNKQKFPAVVANALKSLFFKSFSFWKILFKEAKNNNACAKSEVIIQHKNISFSIVATSANEIWRANSFWEKEPETISWLQTELQPDSVFWDVGANIGLYSLYGASFQPKCQIMAFEPESQNFASLCKNIFQNNFKNIDAFGLALSEKETEISDLYVSSMEAGSAIHNIREKSPWAKQEAVFSQKTFSTSVDALVIKYKIPPPTIVKIDVDGIEINILRGSLITLRNSIKTLLIELDGHMNSEILAMNNIMRESGFDLLTTSNRKDLVNNKLPKNFIWRKP